MFYPATWTSGWSCLQDKAFCPSKGWVWQSLQSLQTEHMGFPQKVNKSQEGAYLNCTGSEAREFRSLQTILYISASGHLSFKAALKII